jgi:hypothetical protein
MGLPIFLRAHPKGAKVADFSISWKWLVGADAKDLQVHFVPYKVTGLEARIEKATGEW